MALRYSCKAAQVSTAGTVFVHGLVGPLGTGPGPQYQAPDEWKGNLRGPGPGATGLYVNGTPTSQTITFAAVGGAGTADVFCAINHSFVQ